METQENIKFLRVFQIFGVLPFKLNEKEKNFAEWSRVILILFLIFLIIIRGILIHSELTLLILFLWDVMTLLTGQLCMIFTKKREKDILKLISEIDGKIEFELHMRKNLELDNVKMQRKIATTWLIYSVLMLYYPISRQLKNDASTLFFDSVFRIISWSFLVHVNLTKFLYFFSLLSVRLEIIKNCLNEIQNSTFYSKLAHYSIYRRVMTLKEIYYRCWLIQENSLIASGFFLLIYFIGYVGQIMYITFFFMKRAILENNFEENLFDNVLWLSLLNVFTIAFFIVSHKIYSKGLKISGLIHQIAHNSIRENQLVEAVKLFSLQIQQQPMTHINIYGIFYYDRSNINAIILLYTSLFYEAFHINLKLIDLKETAKELGVSENAVVVEERKLISIN